MNSVCSAETQQASESVIDAFRGLDVNILIQEFIKEAAGSDIRCFVVGGKVVASMMRTAKQGEFRSNLHRGGRAESLKITEAERKTAIQAAKEMNLPVAGVDLLRSKRGPLVLEVNSSPGLKGIETATEIDVSCEIIKYIEKQVKSNIKNKKVEG